MLVYYVAVDKPINTSSAVSTRLVHVITSQGVHNWPNVGYTYSN